jgi:ATP-dependent helicase/nuclease subunit B
MLPARARRLFGPPDDVRPSVPSTVSFTLRPSVPAQVDTTVRMPSRLSVTSLRDYLACPFRFYLTHILRMQALADTKHELDAADFGSLVHDVMARLARDEEMRCCTRVPPLQRFLDKEVRRWAEQRFSTDLPLHLRLQLNVARERLEAAAKAQAQLASEGWEIVICEQEFQLPVGQMRVRGRIDRVDKHRETGRIRVLDYKTGDSGKAPEEYHLASARAETPHYAQVTTRGRLKRWTDLQLPLYHRMLEHHESLTDGIETGYFNMPRDIASTGVVLWDGLTDDLLHSADTCAEGVITDIAAHRFWPPSARVDFDDYGALFPTDIARCIDAASFTEFLESWKE